MVRLAAAPRRRGLALSGVSRGISEMPGTSATYAPEFSHSTVSPSLSTRGTGIATAATFMPHRQGSQERTGAVDVVETAITQGGAVFTLAFHWAEK